MRWLLGDGLARRIGRASRSLARRSGDHLPTPDHRAFELIVHDLRRLHRRFCETRSGVSFAKSEAVRRAYDGALAEGCDALGLAHLLAVLEAGEELDRERARVEQLLHRWGLVLDEPA
ncbi:MAG TPA: hypothetical protein VFI99_03070 [Nocardioides sp.]|jgi:hypothetical protein|nr:hypothetical protein [Nocardioides sp.]